MVFAAPRRGAVRAPAASVRCCGRARRGDRSGALYLRVGAGRSGSGPAARWSVAWRASRIRCCSGRAGGTGPSLVRGTAYGFLSGGRGVDLLPRLDDARLDWSHVVAAAARGCRRSCWVRGSPSCSGGWARWPEPCSWTTSGRRAGAARRAGPAGGGVRCVSGTRRRVVFSASGASAPSPRSPGSPARGAVAGWSPTSS